MGYYAGAPAPRPGAPPPRPAPRAASPTISTRAFPAGPPASSRDYNALRIATAVLSGRFFTEIRSKRNLSYAVEAPFIERALSTGGVYVTTVAPDATLELMREELDE